MKRNQILLLALVCLSGMMAVADSVRRWLSRPEPTRPVLSVSLSLAESEWEVFRTRVFPSFERKHACAVEAVQVDSADLPKLLEIGKVSGESSLDLFAQDNMALTILIRKSLVLDLSSLEQRLPREMNRRTLEGGRFDGKLYFVPFRSNVQIFYYNRAKFDEHGLNPPQSWEEWLEVAKTFHQREGTGRILIKGFGGAPTVTQMYEYVVAAGGDPFSFRNQNTKKAFAFFQELWKYASPDSRRAKWDTSNDYLARDSVYLMQNWPFGYRILTKEYGKNNIGVYHGFSGPAREAHVIGGDVLGIPVGSGNKELAVQLIQHLLSREVQVSFVRELGWPSVRSDAYGQSDSPDSQAIAEALQHGIYRKNVPYWNQYQKLFEEAFLRVVIEGEDLSLLDQLQRRMENITGEP